MLFNLKQIVYTTMEKHFVELKQELFDTKLQVITLNSTLYSSNGIRHDLLSIGQAIANTTSYITKRIDKVKKNKIYLQLKSIA